VNNKLFTDIKEIRYILSSAIEDRDWDKTHDVLRRLISIIANEEFRRMSRAMELGHKAAQESTLVFKHGT